ncbi:armadillo-type protein [Entophlyctis helioformis]|nr:armadillo-type protein [Entophlyctis helioformis]
MLKLSLGNDAGIHYVPLAPPGCTTAHSDTRSGSSSSTTQACNTPNTGSPVSLVSAKNGFPSSKSLPPSRRNSSADLNALWGLDKFSLNSPTLEKGDAPPFMSGVGSASRRLMLSDEFAGDAQAAPPQFSDKFLLDDDASFSQSYQRSMFGSSSAGGASARGDGKKLPLLMRRESYSAVSMPPISTSMVTGVDLTNMPQPTSPHPNRSNGSWSAYLNAKREASGMAGEPSGSSLPAPGLHPPMGVFNPSAQSSSLQQQMQSQLLQQSQPLHSSLHAQAQLQMNHAAMQLSQQQQQQQQHMSSQSQLAMQPPRKTPTPNPYGQLGEGSSWRHDMLNDTAFFPQKPTQLTSSFSSPDLSAFRLKAAFGDLANHPDRALFMQQQQSNALAVMGLDVEPTSPGGSGTYGICRYFLQGYCSRGHGCNFAHVMNMNALNQTARQQPLPLGLQQTQSTMNYPSAASSSSASAAAAAGFNMLNLTPQQAAALYQHNLMSGMPGLYPTLSYSASGSGYGGSLNAPLKFHPALQKPKKHVHDEAASRFANAALEDLVGQIYALCKDQHGCRFLQKKLEEQNEKHLSIIFNEAFPNFTELMTDPFGNYLCQKLFEYCTEDQRTMLVEHVASELVNISLNMHGTRAVQKLIEFVTSPVQIRTVVAALGMNVVVLIKDLNGNHVIQKCLNRLSHENNQFIYNAVTKNCIEVATHRHGCCVLQRCIDHASEPQRMQLVSEITYNALTLVQDPFGNYVVQYVLDLSEHLFSEAIIRRFIGNICLLSVQKFSSNVIEKCIRVSSHEIRAFMIDELLNKDRLEKLLRDSYGNYVVQTSLDYAEPSQRALLVECIRPLLPSIRNTPYGKRIQTKIMRDPTAGPPLSSPGGPLSSNYGMMPLNFGFGNSNGLLPMGNMY